MIVSMISKSDIFGAKFAAIIAYGKKCADILSSQLLLNLSWYIEQRTCDWICGLHKFCDSLLEVIIVYKLFINCDNPLLCVLISNRFNRNWQTHFRRYIFQLKITI